MNTALFYGLVLGLAGIVLSLISYFLGFQTDKIALEPWVGLVQLAVSVTVLWLGIRAAREDSKDKSLTYGRGVRTGFLISLYSTLISIVYSVIHVTYINPAYPDYKIEALRHDWARKGMTDAQMASLEKFTRMLFSPVLMSIYLLIVLVALGVVISLVLAAFLKRAAAPDLPPVISPEPPPA